MIRYRASHRQRRRPDFQQNFALDWACFVIAFDHRGHDPVLFRSQALEDHEMKLTCLLSGAACAALVVAVSGCASSGCCDEKCKDTNAQASASVMADPAMNPTKVEGVGPEDINTLDRRERYDAAVRALSFD